MPSQDRDLLTRILGYGDISKEEEQYGKNVAIHAPKRKGKTLTMLMCVNYFLEALPFIEGVISNLPLMLPEPYSDMVIPLKDIKMIGKNEYRKYIIALDELGHIIESRMSSSFRNIFISNLLADTGKYKQILLYTNQEASQIDKRIRNNVDIIFRPSINFDNGLMQTKIIKGYYTYFMIDAYQQWNEYDIEFYFPFRQYYSWYDTGAKIEEYVLTFTPEDYLEQFLTWWKDEGYEEQNIKITSSTLNLWKETKGITITRSQLSALIEYMLRKTDLPLYRRKKGE